MHVYTHMRIEFCSRERLGLHMVVKSGVPPSWGSFAATSFDSSVTMGSSSGLKMGAGRRQGPFRSHRYRALAISRCL